VAELSLDTASDLAGIALTEEGALVSELTWRTRRNQSRELLPALDWLLERGGLSKSGLRAIFVCIGPGSYAGLRVGLSTAKALAYALDIPIAGVNRLEADAALVATPAAGVIVPVHAAGRADLAWARYRPGPDGPVEITPPRLSPLDAFLEALVPGDLVCGELGDDLKIVIRARGVLFVDSPLSRVLAVSRIGWRRLRAGTVDSADSLVPLYLREPAIGPQPPR
jgi:tRNA threonylcarbamoyl adenosine modification protein YeaZ